MTTSTAHATKGMSPLTWADIRTEVQALADRHRANTYTGVHGVPTGGSVVAALVAPLLALPILDTPSPGALVVDDLVDTGTTLRSFAAYECDALYRKPWSPDEVCPDATRTEAWLVFPWEHDNGAPTDAVTRLLQYLGEDPTRPGLIDTPRRVTKALRELTAGYQEDPGAHLERTFPLDNYQGPVLVSFPFSSLCEHHLFPFAGHATLYYEPNDAIVGLSKLPRMFMGWARRLQVQERLTQQALDSLVKHLAPRSAGVAVTSAHSCMSHRGIGIPGRMTTTSVYGDPRLDQLMEAHRNGAGQAAG